MVENIISWFAVFPKELATFFIAMLPFTELRASIPLAVAVYKLPPASAFFYSVLGNIIPPIIAVFLLDSVSKWLSFRFTVFRKFFSWIFERTHRKAHGKIEKYGHWGLFVLVAIPLPMTGGWTGALAAFLFGIDKRKSIPMIILGVAAAGVIVVILTAGAVNFR